MFCTFNLSSINLKSSTLTTLKANVKSFDDCLYLLDGRLNCLSKLIIGIKIIADTSGTIDNTVSMIVNSSLSRKKNSECDNSAYFAFLFHRKNFPN